MLQQIKGKDKIVMTRIFSCMTLKDLSVKSMCVSLKIYALITFVFIGLSTVLISKYYCRVFLNIIMDHARSTSECMNMDIAKQLYIAYSILFQVEYPPRLSLRDEKIRSLKLMYLHVVHFQRAIWKYKDLRLL